MLKKLLKNIKFRSVIKKHYAENKKEVLDIILFGSIAKGAETPKDIDILILNKNKPKNDAEYGLRKKLEAAVSLPVQIIAISYEDLLNPEFIARTGFFEGYSLIHKKRTAELFGFSPVALFKYDLTGLSKSKRMLFYYALYGRDAKGGILKSTNSIKLSAEVVLSSIEQQSEFRDFFKNHNIKYSDFTALIPAAMFGHLRRKS